MNDFIPKEYWLILGLNNWQFSPHTVQILDWRHNLVKYNSEMNYNMYGTTTQLPSLRIYLFEAYKTNSVTTLESYIRANVSNS